MCICVAVRVEMEMRDTEELLECDGRTDADVLQRSHTKWPLLATVLMTNILGHTVRPLTRTHIRKREALKTKDNK